MPLRVDCQLLATTMSLLCLASAAASEGKLQLLSGERFTASLVRLSDGSASFLRPESDARVQSMPLANVVKWGTPAEGERRPTLVLRQGSRLIAAPTWTREGSLRYADGNFNLRQTLLDDVVMPRAMVELVLLEAARDPFLFDRVVRKAGAYRGGKDRIWLTNGDAFSGELGTINSGRLELTSEEQPLTFELGSVVAVKLTGGAERGDPPANVAIGMRDGGLLLASGAELSRGGTLRVSLTPELTLTGRRPGAVVMTQPLTGRVTYLSDLEPLDYRHTPYFDLGWAYGRDRDLLGRPLRSGGQPFLKGLSMHSGSRLVYRTPDGMTRFDGSLAVAGGSPATDGARGSSVVGRVFVARGGKFEEVFVSQTVREGDAPVAVSVDIEAAQAIALVVEDAGDGDTRDHARWLDARFVR
ncbi:MAG: NPCBM/NEW2 domain-containing protein [Planctomycetota bacterium]